MSKVKLITEEHDIAMLELEIYILEEEIRAQEKLRWVSETLGTVEYDAKYY